MTSVAELFSHAGLVRAGSVPWGDAPTLSAPGVYLVSTFEDHECDAGLEVPPLDSQAVGALLAVRPEASVDGAPATPVSIAHRLRQMWPAGEPVVYVGLAGTSVSRRVRQFYSTEIGARAPHAGGWPVKMLDASKLWVHFAVAPDPDLAERVMLERFVSGLGSDVRSSLIDPNLALPFANLTMPRGGRKKHGFSGVKASRTRRAHPEVLNVREAR